MRSRSPDQPGTARDRRPRRTLPFVIVALGIFVVQVAIIAVAALITDLPV
jgi:hypothetical protein